METNREVSDGDPAEYIPTYEERHPGAVGSHWIPMDPELWRIDNYLDFLETRRELLATAANDFLNSLRAGELAPSEPGEDLAGRRTPAVVEASDDEATAIAEINEWVSSVGLATGEVDYELVDEASREVDAILDIAWPDGLQAGLWVP